MPPTYKDFKARISEAPLPAPSINPELLRVAAVQAQDLTGHPAWDAYLSKLQAHLDQARLQVQEWTSKCVNAYTDADMRLAQRMVVQFQTEVDVLEKVIAMPHAIIAEYKTLHPEKAWSAEETEATVNQ